MVYSSNDLVRAAPPPSFPSPKEPLTFGQGSGDRNVGPLTLSSDICQLLSMRFTKLMVPGFPGIQRRCEGQEQSSAKWLSSCCTYGRGGFDGEPRLPRIEHGNKMGITESRDHRSQIAQDCFGTSISTKL